MSVESTVGSELRIAEEYGSGTPTSGRVVAGRCVALVGILLTLLCAWRVPQRPGVYWSEVQLVFIAPPTNVTPNVLASASDSLIATAGAVVKIVGSSTPVSPVSESVDLVGDGVRDGYQVRLPNSGGQWATDFDSPSLDVQAAGPTSAGVTARMAGLIARIRAVLVRLQDETDASPTTRIAITASPEVIPVYYGKGSAIRATGACLVLGLGATAAAARWTARWTARCARRRTSTA